MHQKTNIEIPLSKSKLSKLLVISFLFLLAAFWMIIKDPQVSNPVFNNIIVKTIAKYGGTVMGAFGIYFFTRKLIDKNPGIVIDENGVTDNTSAFSLGFISWADISCIGEKTIQASIASKEHFVTIALINTEKYIAREKNPVKRMWLKASAKNNGSLVNISTNGLKTTHKDLLAILTNSFDEYRRF